MYIYLALYASAASATCSNSGATWASTSDANTQLITVCSELAGTYAPGQDRQVCRDGYGKYEFEVRNQNGYAVTLSKDACVLDWRR